MSYVVEIYILAFAVLLFLAIIAGKVGSKIGVPILLLFMIVGMLCGSDGLGIEFNNFGYAESIGAVALSIILFSGGLDTNFSDIKPVLYKGIALSTAGVLLTALFTGLAIYAFLMLFVKDVTMSLIGAFLLASIMSSTDSASVFALLRAKDLSLKYKLRPLLELESGSNDPVAYLLVITLMSIMTGEVTGFWNVIGHFVMQIVFGVGGGFLLGKLCVRVMKKINIQYDALYPIILLTFSLFTYSFVNVIHGNGYLAVYIAGLIVGNSKFIHKRTAINFFDGISWLMQIVMFLSLGLLVEPNELLGDAALLGVVIAIILVFISRPLAVLATLLPFRKKRLHANALTFVSFVGLKGAVPIVFAIYPLAYDIPNARFMFNVVFVVTIISLLLQGTLIPTLAKRLKLVLPGGVSKRLSNFDVAFSDDVKYVMSEVNVEPKWLQNGNKIMDLPIPVNTLIVLIKREDKYILPKGAVTVEPNDKLLLITDDVQSLKHTYNNLGIAHNLDQQE